MSLNESVDERLTLKSGRLSTAARTRPASTTLGDGELAGCGVTRPAVAGLAAVRPGQQNGIGNDKCGGSPRTSGAAAEACTPASGRRATPGDQGRGRLGARALLNAGSHPGGGSDILTTVYVLPVAQFGASALRLHRNPGSRDAVVTAVIRSTGRPCPASKERQAMSMRKMQDMLQVTHVEPAISRCVNPEPRPNATLRPVATATPVPRETALSLGGGRG